MDSSADRVSSARHFILVHGACHGAWCWYKVSTMLQESGFRVTAPDLRSCGRDTTDPKTVTTLEALAEPVVRLFSELPSDEKVILVGHSFGGVVATLLMEQFPEKIAVAVFLTARMFPSGDGADEVASKVFSLLEEKFRSTTISANVMPSRLAEILYHLSPPEDVTLAKVLLKPFPILPTAEILVSHTQAKYGCVPRVYIKCLNDQLFSPEVVDVWLQTNPPAQVLELNCDHSPFFSATRELHQSLLQIATTYG
eukprot:TRINITY_DN19577_c0_g1_i1.p1 TRINITY_DN19577_c0_g1~~TRINITY_DN19577_c0_g1_i1.p1  ORF type:complete len:254 (+),score=24.07 TRINITY_DN19577_c0_g1_i1:228-989(+)